jgi:putative PIN family toxin of toxin-antitoxin system
VRVLLDANVLVSALLSRGGAPARLVGLWLEAEFELVVCPALLAETNRALASSKLRGRVDPGQAERFIEQVAELGEVVPDPEGPPRVRSSDPGDDYLLALAERENVPLISGDHHLLALRDRAPVFSPRDFVEQL